MNTRRKITIKCDPELGKTQQHYKDECDINTIIRKYNDTGLLPMNMAGPPQYGYATSQTFTEALQTVALSTQEFMKLPSEIRTEFNNNPAEFLDALHDPSRRDELVKLGLIPKGEANASPELPLAPKPETARIAPTGDPAQPLQRRKEDPPPSGDQHKEN